MWEAFFIGLAISAAVGPMSLFFMRKTLDIGVKGALAVGLGIALADALYALIGGLGMTFVSNILIDYTPFIRIFGGGCLIYLGIKEFNKKAIVDITTPITAIQFPIALFVLSIVLTLSNPMTILSFIGILSSLKDIHPVHAVFGIFCGSITWWIILGSIILLIKHRLTPFWINTIRYVSSAALIGFGVYTLIQNAGG